VTRAMRSQIEPMLRAGRLSCVVLCWILLGTVSAISSDVPARDERSFTNYFASELSAALTEDKVTAASVGRIEITSRAGARVQLESSLVREECLTPPNAWGSCVERMVRYYAAFLKPAQPDAMLLRLANYVEGSWYLKTLPTAIPWKSRAFGTFQADCMKGAPDYSFPVTSWDGANLKTSVDGVGAICTKSTQAILGSVQTAAANFVPNKINVLTGKSEASLTAFLSQWSPLAKQWGGLIISIPDPDTILLTNDNDAVSLGALRERAKSAVAAEPPTHDRLTDDVYRWTERGWILVP